MSGDVWIAQADAGDDPDTTNLVLGVYADPNAARAEAERFHATSHGPDAAPLAWQEDKDGDLFAEHPSGDGTVTAYKVTAWVVR
jgi:hypothetical protein